MPTPSDAEIVKVRRAAGLTSKTETESLISALDDDEWAAAEDLADKWLAVGFADLDGRVKLKAQSKRDAYRRQLRTLLGLSPFAEDDPQGQVPTSEAVAVEAW